MQKKLLIKTRRRTIPAPLPTHHHSKRSFLENVERLKEDWARIAKSENLTRDPRFLQRMALTIRHLKHESEKVKNMRQLRKKAIAVESFISPFLLAAASYGEQDPQSSDLAHLLQKSAPLPLSL